jgi:hypothetical protein
VPRHADGEATKILIGLVVLPGLRMPKADSDHVIACRIAGLLSRGEAVQ